MSATVRLHSVHAALPALESGLFNQQRLLGAIYFSASAAQLSNPSSIDAPILHIPLNVIAGDDFACEFWAGDNSSISGRAGDIRYRHGDNYLFGILQIDEHALESDQTGKSLQHATENAYRQIFALLDNTGYPCPLRFWNYMAHINRIDAGVERYQQFNYGRQEAWRSAGRRPADNLPAACALGTDDGPLTIAFLAGRISPLAIQNPRQINAYEYPPDYGVRSPSFSRASQIVLADKSHQLLLISGTASIVGHATQHAGDVLAQTRETLSNIQSVINESMQNKASPAYDLVHAMYRVYLRHAEDRGEVHREMQRILGTEVKALFVQADICRSDLLVEIELSLQTFKANTLIASGA